MQPQCSEVSKRGTKKVWPKHSQGTLKHVKSGTSWQCGEGGESPFSHRVWCQEVVKWLGPKRVQSCQFGGAISGMSQSGCVRIAVLLSWRYCWWCRLKRVWLSRGLVKLAAFLADWTKDPISILLVLARAISFMTAAQIYLSTAVVC